MELNKQGKSESNDLQNAPENDTQVIKSKQDGRQQQIKQTHSVQQHRKMHDLQRKIKEAKSYFQTINMLKKIQGQEQIQRADVFHNYGMRNYSRGQLNSSLQCLNKALSIYQRVYGIELIKCTSTLYNIGLVFYNQRNIKQAYKYYSRILKIKQKAKERELIQFAQILRKMTRIDSPLNYYNQIMSYQSLKSKSSPQQTRTQLQKVEYYSQNQKMLDLALEKTKAQMIDNQFDSRLNEAAAYYLNTMNVKDTIRGQQPLDIANSFIIIGDAYANQQQYQQALKQYFEAMMIYNTMKEVSSENYAVLSTKIAIMQQNRSMFIQAFEFFDKALTIFEKNKGKKSSEYADIKDRIRICGQTWWITQYGYKKPKPKLNATRSKVGVGKYFDNYKTYITVHDLI